MRIMFEAVTLTIIITLAYIWKAQYTFVIKLFIVGSGTMLVSSHKLLITNCLILRHMKWH